MPTNNFQLIKMKKKASEKTGRALQIRSKNYRLVIPDLKQYQDSTPAQLLQLKGDALQFLLQSQKNRALRYYCIALQLHPTTRVPHLDILLVYDQSVQTSLNRFDKFLKHGNLTNYRDLNKAILEYGRKEDINPLSNLPPDTTQIVELQPLKRDPYRYLELQMLKDPLNFKVQQYVRQHDLAQYITAWSSIKNKLKDMQIAAANLLLRSKPGFQLITQELIQSRLSDHQLKLYFGPWDGYRRIVHHLNSMIQFKGFRQQKELNLLITGSPNCGKSALVWQRDPLPGRASILQFCSVYPIGMSQWFPKYQSDVYHMIYWNEAKLTSYSYDTILKLLDGSPLDLPSKGSVSRKIDNPLILMTSNMTLQQMLYQKFSANKIYLQMARQNLSVRIQNVIVPPDHNLFLLQKLLVFA